MFLILALALAHAAEVVWLSEPTPEQAAQVALTAGAVGEPIDVWDFRAATTDWSESDQQALDALSTTLEEVRPYESRLDGELVIMQELARPVASVSVIRDEDDRDALFRTLVYQGFAIHRYFADELATDDKAAAYRLDTDRGSEILPWVDAIAIAPDREVTPYEIAEAPSRVAYKEMRRRFGTALPGLLLPPDLPSDAQLILDGRPVETTAGRSLKVHPGRHLAHIERNDRIVARFDLRILPAESQSLEWDNRDPAFEAWSASLGTDHPSAPPPGIDAAIEALGGEVVLAVPTEKRVRAWTVRPGEVQRLDLRPAQVPSTTDPESEDGLSFEVSAGGGWMGSQDFYFQDPTVVDDPVFSTVNAATLGGAIGISWDAGLFRAVAGTQVLVPFGPDKGARIADRTFRPRPVPYAGAGIRYVQAVVGYAFPYHPWAGGRLTIPLVGPLELRATAGVGLGLPLKRRDGSTYEAHELGTGWAGIGVRL